MAGQRAAIPAATGHSSVPMGREKSPGKPALHRDFPDSGCNICGVLHSESWFVKYCKAWVNKEEAPLGILTRVKTSLIWQLQLLREHT